MKTSIFVLLCLCAPLFAQSDVSQSIDALRSQMAQDAKARDDAAFRNSMNNAAENIRQVGILRAQQRAAARADQQAFESLRPPDQPTLPLLTRTVEVSAPTPAPTAARFQFSTANGSTLKLDTVTGETWQFVIGTNAVGHWVDVTDLELRKKLFVERMAVAVADWKAGIERKSPGFFDDHGDEFQAKAAAMVAKSGKSGFNSDEMLNIWQKAYDEIMAPQINKFPPHLESYAK